MTFQIIAISLINYFLCFCVGAAVMRDVMERRGKREKKQISCSQCAYRDT